MHLFSVFGIGGFISSYVRTVLKSPTAKRRSALNVNDGNQVMSKLQASSRSLKKNSERIKNKEIKKYFKLAGCGLSWYLFGQSCTIIMLGAPYINYTCITHCHINLLPETTGRE